MTKKQSGITLIALIVTIIIMIILAGVTINLTMGENGIFSQSKVAAEQYKLENEFEQIKLAYVSAQIKVLQQEQDLYSTFDEELKSISAKIKSEDDEFYIVQKGDRYFKVNKKSQEVQLYDEEITDDTKAPNVLATYSIDDKQEEAVITITVQQISQENNIYVKVNGNEITKNDENKYVYTAKTNGEYNIEVEEENITLKGTYKINVTGIVETLYISKKSELNDFIVRVNNGETFKGKRVKLQQNIECNIEENLESISGDFLGTFDGQGHKISNLKIESNAENLGIFNQLSSGAVIQNLILNNSTINNSYNEAVPSYTGGLAGKLENGAIIQNCSFSGSITSTKTSDGSTVVGGIVGINYGIIQNCSNKASIIATNSNTGSRTVFVGGIAGYNYNNILNCYNTGNIVGIAYNVTIGGISGFLGRTTETAETNIKNCYNVGAITMQANSSSSNRYAGGISGRNGNNSSAQGTIDNCYYVDNVTNAYFYYKTDGTYGKTTTNKKTEQEMQDSAIVEALGEAYEQVNSGFPILDWES